MHLRLLFSHGLTGPNDRSRHRAASPAPTAKCWCKQALPRQSRRPPMQPGETDMTSLDLRGLVPAPVTPSPATARSIDAIQRLGAWLGSFDGVKGLVVLGHAAKAPSSPRTNRPPSSKASSSRPTAGFRSSPASPRSAQGGGAGGQAGCRGRAAAGLVYPSHGWLRFGCRRARRRTATGPSSRRAACR